MKADNLTMTMLFDLYGELLTDRQRDCFDLYYNDDLSLSEIGEQFGITRQGIRDNILHAKELLKRFEEKTGMVRRFTEMQKQIDELETSIKRVFDKIDYSGDDVTEILTQLENLKG